MAALHYLMKPVREEKFFSVLDRAADKLRKNERTLTLECAGEVVRVPLYQIRYVDVQHNYATVHAKADYTVKKTLAEIETKPGRAAFTGWGGRPIVNLQLHRQGDPVGHSSSTDGRPHARCPAAAYEGGQPRHYPEGMRQRTMGIICKLAFQKDGPPVSRPTSGSWCETHYQEVENMYRQMRGWRHDWRNHLQAHENPTRQRATCRASSGYLDELDTGLYGAGHGHQDRQPDDRRHPQLAKFRWQRTGGFRCMADAHIPVRLQNPGDGPLLHPGQPL